MQKYFIEQSLEHSLIKNLSHNPHNFSLAKFLDLCCQSFSTEKMTEKGLNICQTLCGISELFKDEIYKSRGYFRALIRFCSEFVLKEKEDRDQALILLDIIEPIFDEHHVDCLGEIAEAIQALAQYNWAMKKLFESDSK